MANKIAYKYDVRADDGSLLIATTLKVARQFKKQIKASGVNAYIVKQQYLPIYDKVVY